MPDLSRTDADSSSPLEYCGEDSGNLWGIVLLEHRSPKPPAVTPRFNGTDLFKHYCTEIGHRHWVQRTLDRVSSLTTPNERLVVTSRDRLEKDLEDVREPDVLLVQPYNRDSGPGVLLALLRIQGQDPDATVAIFPSEHCAFIPDDEVLTTHVLQGIKFVTAYPDLLMLLGTVPDRPEMVHDWIEPGPVIARQSGYRFLQVRGIREGRDRPMAARPYLEGGLGNSRIVLGRLSTLLQSFQKTLPELWERFQRIEAALDNAQMLEDVYRGMPVANFSRHVLQKIPQGLGVVPVKEEKEEQETIFKTSVAAKEAEGVLSAIESRYPRWGGAL